MPVRRRTAALWVVHNYPPKQANLPALTRSRYACSKDYYAQNKGCLVAVGTEVTFCPPHRSVRAELPHTAPTSGVTHKSAPLDMGAYYGVVEQTAQQSD